MACMFILYLLQIDMDSDEVYDIAVIGGGVMGCSTLFHLTNKGYRCILLEKNKHLVSEASAGNRSLCILLEGIFLLFACA
jgi:glycerol-3-phosphate dehydrogenase